jgi:hypothetical protein
MTDMDLLRLQFASAFVLNAEGRLVFHNDPDRSRAPLVAISGCAERCICALRDDVAGREAEEVLRMVAEGAPFAEDALTIDHVARIFGRTKDDGSAGLVWPLPHTTVYPSDAALVRSGTTEGDALLRRLEKDGMPPSLVEIGFLSVADFWAPWSALLMGGEVAAIGFSARLGDEAADLGLVTLPAFRGRGLGAAATAAWAAPSRCCHANPVLQHNRHEPVLAARGAAVGVAIDRTKLAAA